MLSDPMGIRVFVPFEDKGFMYAGTASQSNLRAPEVDDPGDFQFMKLTPTGTR
jgi:hypothetical protein